MIKAGDRWLCYKDVCMNGNPKDIAYRKGTTYISEIDGCLTDEDGNKDHHWSNLFYFDSFFCKSVPPEVKVKESYCSFEVSKLLKELGFQSELYTVYYEDGTFEDAQIRYDNSEPDLILAPSIWIAISWVWKRYGIWIEAISKEGKFMYNCQSHTGGFLYDTPEEAIEAGILRLLDVYSGTWR